MATPEEKVLRLRIDTTHAERDISNMASRVSHTLEARLARFGQLAAFGAVGYGAYRLYQTQFGQGAINVASAAFDNIRNATGFSSPGATVQQHYLFPSVVGSALGQPAGFDGLTMNPAHTVHYGSRDLGQRVGAGLVGALTGTGLTAAMFAGGWALSRAGIMQPITAAAGSLGTAVGGAALSTPINLAGRAVGGLLRHMGWGPAGDAVVRGAGFIAGGAAQVGRFVGGLFGPTLPLTVAASVVTRAGERIAQNVAVFREMQDQMDEIGYRYTFGRASNIATGRGFGARDQADIARTMRRTLLDEEFIRQTDFGEILSGIVDSELDFHVRSAEEFKQKFSKTVEVLRDIARVFETSLEGAVGLLGDMQRSGFYTTADQTAMLFRANALARVSGMTSAQLVGQGVAGAEQARSYGFMGTIGSSLRTSLVSMIQMRPDFMDPARRGEFQAMLQDLGGAEGVAGSITDLFLRLGTREDAKLALYGLVDLDTGLIDHAALDDFRFGRIDFAEMIRRGVAKAGRNQQEFERFKNESDRYFSQLTGSDSVAFFGSFLQSIQRSMGLTDMRSLLASLGVDDQFMRQVMDETLFGSAMRSEGALMTEEMQRVAMAESAAYRTPRGFWERHFAKPAERFWAFASEPFVNLFEWVNTGVQDWYNTNILRISSVDIDPGFLSPERQVEGLQLMHFYEFMQDQLDVIRAIDQISTTLTDAGQIYDLQRLKQNLEELFDTLARGEIGTEGFRAQVARFASEANISSDKLETAINKLAANTMGAEAAFGSGPLSSDIFESSYDALTEATQRRAVVSGVLSSMQQSRYFSSDAMRVVESLSEHAEVTGEMFRQATAGLPPAQRALVAERLASRMQKERDFSVEQDAHFLALLDLQRSFGDMSSRTPQADAVDAAIIRMLEEGVRVGEFTIPYSALDLVGDSAFLEAWRSGDLEGFARRHRGGDPFIQDVLIPAVREGREADLIDYFFGVRTRSQALVLESLLDGVPDGPAKDAVRRFLLDHISGTEASYIEGLRVGSITPDTEGRFWEGIRLDLPRFTDILSDLGIVGADERSEAQFLLGRAIQMLERSGVPLGGVSVGSEGFWVAAMESLLGGTYEELGIRPSDLRLRDFERFVMDDGLRHGLAVAYGELERGNIHGYTRIMESLGLEGANAIAANVLRSWSAEGEDGPSRVLRFLREVEYYRYAQEEDSLRRVLGNRFAAIGTGIREVARGVSDTEFANMLYEGSAALLAFADSGQFRDFSALYGNEAVLESLKMINMGIEAEALRWGELFWSTPDFDEARTAILKGAAASLLPGNYIDLLRAAETRESFGMTLDAAIASVFQGSLIGSGGTQTIYHEQGAGSEALAGAFARQLQTPLYNLDATNRRLVTMIESVGSVLDKTNELLGRIEREGRL